MVREQLALGLLQLVALSLPAFAILLQLVVESDFPYTKEAVPITTAGFSMFILAGLIVLAEILLSAASVLLSVVLLLIGVGLLSMLVGASLIGIQTHRAQIREEETNDQES